ncbi:terminase small subunit [Amycolatopsis sp. NPDC004772]
MSLYDAVDASIKELDLSPRDKGAAELARVLAREIDEERSGRTKAELAAKLQTALTALGLTPESRKGDPVAPREGKLSRLRALPPPREA